MTRSRLEPFFLDSSGGRIFVLLRAPAGAQRCILFVPPFGEEMNKTRRQFTITAQILVNHGFAVLLPDLFGTGDSEGEFGGATWDNWKADIHASLDWIKSSNYSLGGIVAVRLGCALAADCVRDARCDSPKSVFWQPVSSGRHSMNQFLRLRVAASMMASGDRETVDGLRRRLQSGTALSVAGYELTPVLWRSIEAVDLAECIDQSVGRLAIIEIGRSQGEGLSPANTHLIAAMSMRGVDATSTRLTGDPFWSATEIVINHEVARCTAEHLTGIASR